MGMLDAVPSYGMGAAHCYLLCRGLFVPQPPHHPYSFSTSLGRSIQTGQKPINDRANPPPRMQYEVLRTHVSLLGKSKRYDTSFSSSIAKGQDGTNQLDSLSIYAWQWCREMTLAGGSTSFIWAPSRARPPPSMQVSTSMHFRVWGALQQSTIPTLPTIHPGLGTFWSRAYPGLVSHCSWWLLVWPFTFIPPLLV